MTRLHLEVAWHDLDGDAFGTGWFPNRLEQEERLALRSAGFGAFELRVVGISGRDDHYDSAQAALGEIGRRYILGVDVAALVFRCLPKVEPRRAVRSHNGAFPKSDTVRPESKTEAEVDRVGGSAIGGLVQIQGTSFHDCWGWSADYQRSCIVIAQRPSATQPTSDLVQSLLNSLQGGTTLWIDYAKLVATCSKHGYAVLRRGGDGGENFVNLTVFGDKERCERLAYESRLPPSSFRGHGIDPSE